MLNNKVVTMDESGEMAGFAEFLAGIFAKYADDVKLEDLPDSEGNKKAVQSLYQRSAETAQ